MIRVLCYTYAIDTPSVTVIAEYPDDIDRYHWHAPERLAARMTLQDHSTDHVYYVDGRVRRITT